jgi:glycopeptide antibiotics resistance protein
MRVLRELLLAIHRHPRWGWTALIAYAAAVTFPHEQVQYIVNEIANWMSHKRLYQVSAAILLVQGALFTWVVYKRLTTQPERRTIAAFWILTVALIWGIWRVFTANNVELVHYPQYIPEGMALLALTLSPAESMAWIALFGGLDEGFQYWVLSAGKHVPYDFNDIYMDLLGGAAGMLIALVFLRCESRGATPASWKQVLSRPGVVVILSLVLIGIILWSCGLMLLYQDRTSPPHWFALSRVRMPAFWFQVVANGPNKYHTLSPIEGPILILVTIAVYAILDRRLRISAKD